MTAPRAAGKARYLYGRATSTLFRNSATTVSTPLHERSNIRRYSCRRRQGDTPKLDQKLENNNSSSCVYQTARASSVDHETTGMSDVYHKDSSFRVFLCARLLCCYLGEALRTTPTKASYTHIYIDPAVFESGQPLEEVVEA